MLHFYIYKASNNYLKYGIYNNSRHDRIIEGQTYLPNKIKLIALYKIKETENYRLNYKNYDCIISHLGRKPDKIANIEKLLKINLSNLKNIHKYINKYDGGNEIIDINGKNTLENILINEFPKLGLLVSKYSLHDLIEIQLYLDNLQKNNEININKKLDNELIDTINELNNSIKQLNNSKNEIEIIQVIPKKNIILKNIIPYEYQLYVLYNSLYHFIKDKKGILLWSCGLGKTIMALLICYKLQFSNIIIGLPSKNLIMQWNNEIYKHLNIKPILIYGNRDDSILKKINNTNIVLTTYHSSYKIVNYCKTNNYIFDIKIGDEAHHLVTTQKNDNEATFDKFHLIPSNYSLFMTATKKNIQYNNNNSNNFNKVYNIFHDEKLYGRIIDEKSIKWAIENKKITDYNIICIYNQNEELNNIFNNIKIKLSYNNYKAVDKTKSNIKELFISAYFALKSINDSLITHILVYCNKCESTILINKIINILINMKLFKNINNENIYNEELLSDIEIYHNNLNIKNCSYCNYCKDTNLKCINNHECNTDLANCKIKCLKYKNRKNTIFHNNDELYDCEICKFKKSKYGIISCVYIFGEGFDLPCLNGVVIAEKMNSDIRIVQSCLRPNRIDKSNLNKKAYIIIPTNLDKIDEKLTTVIREMGNNDESIEQKIKLININNISNSLTYIKDNELNINNDKKLLSKLMLELYSRKCFGFTKLTLEKEYKYYKEIYLGKYKCVKDYKNDYSVLKNPDIYFGKYWLGWFNYLSIDTSKWIQNLNDWKDYCYQKNIKNIDDYYNCNDEILPPEPAYFYAGFTNFNYELQYIDDTYYTY